MPDNKDIAVFLDRDGTLIKEVGYLSRLDQIELLPFVGAAIRFLNLNCIKAIVVTNQSGVARGFFSEDMVRNVHQNIQKVLEAEVAKVDAFYYCPHHPEYGNAIYKKECLCRKPNTGMVEGAARAFKIDLSRSYLIGDTERDMKTAKNAGMKGVLVLSGYGAKTWKVMRTRDVEKPDYVALDLMAAVQWITVDIQKKDA